jgi:diamine N-acetyltransferase
MITLREVNSENWRETLTLSVKADQQNFVAGYAPIALVGLAKAYVRPMDWRWQPYAIYAADTMVGFLELALETDAAEQCWLFHFFIDQQYQNQGYGKRAVKKLIDLVRERYRGCRALCLTVHPDNVRAQQLYMSLGFVATGATAFDEPLYRLSL